MAFYNKNKCIKEYEAELEHQLQPYERWIATYEGVSHPLVAHPEEEEPIYKILVIGGGSLHKNAHAHIRKAFEEDSVAMVYGDEDVMDHKGNRREPWFKPEWSPDTFLTHFYFGNMVAIRASYCKQLPELINEVSLEEAYEIVCSMVNRCLEEGQYLHKIVTHVDSILFHARKATKYLGAEDSYDIIRERSILHKINLTGRERLGVQEDQSMVSIIIPSKDNSKMLKECVDSIVQHTKEVQYDIIVVDNGSKESEYTIIQDMSETYGFQYLYEPMEFNYAAMCNKAVAHSTGKLILLLNDDIEITEDEWLSRMLLVARREHVGAVGIKLYYPKGNTLQHIGVSNIQVGPVHKLIGESDRTTHYHGINRFQWNKVAVTGACLLVKRKLYDSVGGLCEELKVTYNDVDFCFRLLEKGYYNVVCNDITAIHRESHSRGNDLEEESKYLRLKEEKKLLYERNPRYQDYDPYYSKHLIQDADYYGCTLLLPCEQPDYEQEPVQSGVRRLPARNKIHTFYYIEEVLCESGYITVRGWSFFHEVDNACYETYVVLENDQKLMWSFLVAQKYRLDVTKIAEHQIHNELSGMIVRFKESILPKGTYTLLLKKKNKITKEVQYINTGKQIQCK